MKNHYKLEALTGAECVAEAWRQIDPEVIAAYPITPQTPIIEKFAKDVADGKVKTKFVPVESEHSAMSYVVGAAAAGVRAMTATASQGLAYMWEVLGVASGLRLPIVMSIACRALSAPINIHGDHSDVMGARDLSWVQIFCETNQEIYEMVLLAVRLAEHPDVKLPVMIAFDGFVTSHSVEPVKIFPGSIVKKFIGEYQPECPLLNIEKPVTYGSITLPLNHFEIKVEQSQAMEKAKKVYLEIGKELSKITGSKYEHFEKYYLDDAKAAIVTTASTCGTTKYVVNKLRKQGKRVGLLKIKLFRPFPYQEVCEALSKIKTIGVLDRSESYGAFPPLFSEIKNALCDARPKLQSYIFGLGGRDIFPEEIEIVFEDLLKGKLNEKVRYVGLK
ncbi:MAG: pyruvate ferredoxin oxidoreductase [Patescibacteria group bacterium]